MPGLPQRPYFRHILQAPGLYLGYASEVFPGVSQACDDGDYDIANQQVIVAANCIREAALYLSPQMTQIMDDTDDKERNEA